jgi:hypothetical protein
MTYTLLRSPGPNNPAMWIELFRWGGSRQHRPEQPSVSTDVCFTLPYVVPAPLTLLIHVTSEVASAFIPSALQKEC